MLKDRAAYILRDTGIDSTFIDDDRTLRNDLADHLASVAHSAKIGLVIGRDRRRHCHNVNIGAGDRGRVSRIGQRALPQAVGPYLPRAVFARLEFPHSVGVYVESNHWVATRERDC